MEALRILGFILLTLIVVALGSWFNLRYGG